MIRPRFIVSVSLAMAIILLARAHEASGVWYWISVVLGAACCVVVSRYIVNGHSKSSSDARKENQ